jgi:hypothetical protein
LKRSLLTDEPHVCSHVTQVVYPCIVCLSCPQVSQEAAEACKRHQQYTHITSSKDDQRANSHHLLKGVCNTKNFIAIQSKKNRREAHRGQPTSPLKQRREQDNNVFEVTLLGTSMFRRRGVTYQRTLKQCQKARASVQEEKSRQARHEHS